jgi:hypothetical protein
MESAQAAQLSTAPMGRKRRRTIPIVDARFQWKYTLIITALGVGTSSVMGYFLYNAHVQNTRLLDLDGNALLQEQVMRGDQIFLLYLIVLVVVMAVALAFWGLIVTHRISGPLHILGRYLSVLADGRYPDLRPLRKRDELQDFFTTFEEAVQSLKARDAALLRDVEDALGAVKKTPGQDALVGRLEKQREVLADALRNEDA